MQLCEWWNVSAIAARLLTQRNSLWIAKLTVSEFLKRLTSRFWKRSYEVGLQTIRYFLLITFVGVLIATLSECQPFDHYWQVIPDPGAKCRQGVAQLVTMGVSDIVTDLLLVCFPIPIVLKSQMHIKRYCSSRDLQCILTNPWPEKYPLFYFLPSLFPWSP